MSSSTGSRSSRRSCEQVRPARRDPPSRPRPQARDAGRSRGGAARPRLRGGADDGVARHRATRARQGARRGRPARLRASGRRRPRPPQRAHRRAPALRARARPDGQPARRHDAAGPRERARPRARRRDARRRRGNRRGRRHDLHRGQGGRHRRRPRRTASTPSGGRDMSRTAVLAYSGGLDTSCAIAWLKEDYGFDEVVAVLVDVGQDADFEPAIARGYAAGAGDVLLVDRKREFAGDQVAKALLANALYEGRYPLVSALSRPVIAEAVAEVALELDAEAVVHGCTGKGNDQLRFELAFKAKYPGVQVIAPLRDTIWTRDEEISFAEARGIPVEAKAEKPYSIDDNLFGRAIEAGILEDAWVAPPEDASLLTSHPSTAPAAVDLVVGFEQGLPVSLDGDELELHELVATLNPLAGAYGIGRIDMIENRAIGIKSRELYEAPAAIALIEAHRALEDVVLTKAEAIAKRELEPKWAKVLYDGLWFSPVRTAYDAFFATTQTLVTGEVRLSLQPGAAVVTGRRSEYALYAETLASYGTGETFPHEASEGFIRIAALEVELAAARERKLAPA